jgi:ribulose-phosphate 3-epimerase
MPKIFIMPSILAADMGRLADECRRAEAAGAEALHVDIMDGHFVPNLSMGPDVVKMARKAVKLPLDTHLMVTQPQHLTGAFIKAGANPLLIHVEAQCDVRAVLHDIRAHKVRAGLTLNPETPVEAVFPFLADVDEVLFMSVHPGFGGQSFIPQVLPKVAELRRRAPELDISIDGGINRATTIAAAEHGVNMFVAGTYLFSAADMPAEIAHMRSAINAAYGKKVA